MEQGQLTIIAQFVAVAFISYAVYVQYDVLIDKAKPETSVIHNAEPNIEAAPTLGLPQSHSEDSEPSGKDKAEVRTKNGLLKGRVALSPQGTEVEEFLGIPFAKPPVGDLRYADPVPYGDFPSGGYDATEFKYACIQYLDTTFGDFEGSDMWNAKNKLSEDCLYLNIWVPRPFRTGRAVMVWIYGGGFYSGSNSLWVYDGKALADHTDVIVASFNYRVGTFGFLGTGDGRIPGNFGLKDQRVAMQWIKDNIEAFGGDPELITAFGESSGAASVGYHMMSAESKDLFKRSIFESGSPDSHWSFMSVQQAQQRSRAFFQSVNCPDDDDVLECLRKLDAMDILSKEWVDLNFLVFPWVPTVDGDFLTDTPHNLLKAGKFVLKDSLLGINKDEGTFWNLYAVEGLSKDGPSLLTHPMYRSGVDVIDWDLSNETRERVKEMYTPLNKSDMAANRDALDDVCGDRSFVCPTAELTDHFVKSGIKTYFYYLTHRASIEVWPPWMGVIHGAEIQWIFGMAMNKSRGYSSEEVWFAKTVMEYWANFAKYGDPNGPTLPYWPQYTQKNPAYMEMKGPYDMFPSYDGPVKSYYCQLWNDINVRINQGLELR